MQKQDFDENELMLLGVLDNAETDAEADPQILLPIEDIHSRTNPKLPPKEIRDFLLGLMKENKFVILSKKGAGITALGRQYLRKYGQPVSPGYWRSKILMQK